MPSSRYEHISYVVSLLIALAPRSLLDVGCGFGRWGFLAREFYDIFQGRYDKSTWQTQIDAVEVFKDYICPHHEYIYNNIYVMKIEEYVKEMPRYDVIFAGDVIEHIEKPDGEALIRTLFSKCNKALIIALPLGKRFPQDEFLGNPYEAHRSVWTKRDLKQQGASLLKVHRMADGRPHAVAVWSHYPLPQFRRRYLMYIRILEGLRPILGFAYPFIRKLLRAGR